MPPGPSLYAPRGVQPALFAPTGRYPIAGAPANEIVGRSQLARGCRSFRYLLRMKKVWWRRFVLCCWIVCFLTIDQFRSFRAKSVPAVCSSALTCYEFKESSASELAEKTVNLLQERRHNCLNVDDFLSVAGKHELSLYYDIPRVIHQIWIGTRSTPDSLLDSWRVAYLSKCVGWSHRLWTDRDVADLTHLRKHFYESEVTLNGKSDWLRAAILYEHGGVYIDADSQWVNDRCLDAFITLASQTGFLVALEPQQAHAAPGVILSVKRHPVLSRMMDMQVMLTTNPATRGSAAWQRVGPGAITAALKRSDNHGQSAYCHNGSLIQHKPGLVVFTLLQSKYFYPVGWTKHNYNLVKNESYVIQLAKEKYPEAVMYQLGLSTHTGEQKG
jgi:mannosyltransferase OCH1-like enzyme